MIIWIIGLSDSGKTTLANKIISNVRKKGRKIIHLDGDAVRELYDNDLGHTIEDRKLNSHRICKICKYLDDQNIDVVVSILSIFPESRMWCRDNLSSYFEIYIKVSLKTLKNRDSKNLYKKYNQGIIKNVVGCDLEFKVPENPDLVIQNEGKEKEFLLNAYLISDKILEQ